MFVTIIIRIFLNMTENINLEAARTVKNNPFQMCVFIICKMWN